MRPSDRFYSIIDYTSTSASAQLDIAKAFAKIQEDWVASYSGFVSARFLASTDGEIVRAIVEWESEEAFHAFESQSDAKGRLEALEAVFKRLTTKGARITFRAVGDVAPTQEKLRDGADT